MVRGATLAVLLAVIAGAAVVWRGGRAIATDLATPRDLHGADYAGSGACRRCHPDHDRSWRRTFHRTMTQDATRDASAVLGDFSGTAYRYGGVTVRMDRDGAGGARMTFARDGGGPERVAHIERTVGSRRYQQYLAREGDVLWRLPMAFHVEERRWFHMNGAFLTPDPGGGEEAPRPPGQPRYGGGAGGIEDYDRHVARWNDNCVFCHNVAPNPGRDPSALTFRTEVAELGVACEACHGPGAEHVRRNHNPIRRYALHLGAGAAAAAEGADPTIVNPSRLSPRRSADLCGRCHGQRIADDVARFYEHGDPFVPGDDLALTTSPLWNDTPLHGDRTAFAARFWPDGTARLTAYEYQGLLQSSCAQRGTLTCTDCHGMHEGDPRGQIRPRAQGDAACTRCHGGLADDAAKARHTRHDVRNPGARCTACHMPRIVYGVIDVHVSHRIEIPDPARDDRYARPDACTGCHVEETRAWAVEQRRRLWPDRAAAAAPTIAEGGQTTTALTGLDRVFAGDPVERAVAVDAMARGGTGTASARPGRRLGVLLDVMENETYPAVRRIAWRAARKLVQQHHGAERPRWNEYDPTGPEAARKAAARQIAAMLPAGAVEPPDAARTAELRTRASSAAIEIGE